MKKIVSLITIGILFSTVGVAQIQRTKPSKAATDSAVVTTPASPVMTDEMPQASRKDKRAMMKELNLSRTQMKQLKGMKQDGKAQKDAITNNTKLTDQERKQQLKELRVSQLKKMQQILTPEQITKLKEMRKQKAGDKMEMDDLDLEEMK
jgi:Spy/CpxP family protein refolding chaperone